MTSIVISYDGTENDTDALALGELLARAGASLSLAYVRHAADPDPKRELAARRAAEELLAAERGSSETPSCRSTSCSPGRRRSACAGLPSARGST